MSEHVETRIRAGRVRGLRRDDGSIAFLGIPFAEPPVGELRFAAPVPHRPWEGVRDALEHGATPKRPIRGEVTLIPEPAILGDSTLNVDVFTPDVAGSAPVLVYIHGGGYTEGSPASPWYDGAAFARDGVVTVNVSYRLGFDGFGWIADAPSNRGLRDLLLALEWVRDDIRSFGGDPDRVTIAGQSAGGNAVLTLMATPAAAGLFRGAWAMSAPDTTVEPERAERLGRRVAELLDVEPTRAGLSTVDELTVRRTQAVAARPHDDPAQVLRELLADGIAWAPLRDGDLLPERPLEALRAGAAHDIPLVIGATDDEFSMALDAAARRLRLLPPSLLLARADVPRRVRRAWLAANREVRRSGAARTVGRFITDAVFRSVVLRALAARGDAPTWAYRFSWRSTKSGIAIHCLDVPFFFDCLDEPHVAGLTGAHPPQELADAVHGAAVAFIRDGDPGWERYPSSGAARRFDLPAGVDSDPFAGARPLL
ncbi:carboxylesterase/lipase family protein [Protaetiibacter mangrovi]|uniref:Carboxylic ester hydrolase n=1 Tax=Protaetiibacter mangrovi TaxID=2970926 RepID=A0ABT1ZHQ8_9MICO|nr:carboxylesterase family protein [Protaetiibacter mangrovi]MCS0500249.1 carboxylesterase family protein [Protaetiibacter mangrovi]TPX03394.1 carboxylesterase family protein [Schumannella luteola]